jgi:hypothetical protein
VLGESRPAERPTQILVTMDHTHDPAAIGLGSVEEYIGPYGERAQTRGNLSPFATQQWTLSEKIGRRHYPLNHSIRPFGTTFVRDPPPDGAQLA